MLSRDQGVIAPGRIGKVPGELETCHGRGNPGNGTGPDLNPSVDMN